MTILYHEFGDTKNVGKTTFFFAIFLHIILPFTTKTVDIYILGIFMNLIGEGVGLFDE